MATVAVVGGGMAGVAAARVLGRAGLQVRLYEREQLGGRLGALQLGEHQVGLGATYVKAKDPLFKAEMAKWEEMGLASEWSVGVPHFIEGPGDFREKPELKGPDDRWHVGRPNMASFVQLSEEDRKQITICGEVSSLRWAEDSWVLNSEDVVAGLILALPVAQLKPLLPAGSEDLLPKELLDKDFEKGRVAAGFVFPERLRLPFRLAFVKDSPISLVLNDSSRLQTGKGEAWVVQTSTEWAAASKDMREEELCGALLAEFARLVGELPAPEQMKAIHWHYGDVDYHLPAGFAQDPSRRLCLCGDWCYNGRVEGAFLSGVRAAGAYLS